MLLANSHKIGVFERLSRGGGLYALVRASDSVGYWHDERPPMSTSSDERTRPSPVGFTVDGCTEGCACGVLPRGREPRRF